MRNTLLPGTPTSPEPANTAEQISVPTALRVTGEQGIAHRRTVPLATMQVALQDSLQGASIRLGLALRVGKVSLARTVFIEFGKKALRSRRRMAVSVAR